MQRALEDAEMWKGTALAALEEVKELKIQEQVAAALLLPLVKRQL